MITGRAEDGTLVYAPGKVTVENRGELVMPLVLKVTYAGGEEKTIKLPVEIWATSNKWTEPLPGGKPIAAVVIDPDSAFPDVARENNSWKQVR